jgi:hypothetical protein
MLRTLINAAILPLELMSVGLTAGDRSSSTGWLVAALVATAAPAAFVWAQRVFGESVEITQALPE